MKRIVIKVGSGILTNAVGLNAAYFRSLSKEIYQIQKKGIEVVLVSSGAIACGMSLMGLRKKPEMLAKKQACAAIGQPELMNLYSKVFGKYGVRTAQILLTRSDLENKNRKLNARQAINELLKESVIPIINENDSVAVEEIKVGDNDQLSAMVAELVHAKLLVILTDIDGLYDADPRKSKSAKRIPLVTKIDKKILSLAQDTKSQKSTGGMITKLKAAEYAGRYKIVTQIVDGRDPKILKDVLAGRNVGTLFVGK